ncbi:elongator complex protein 3 [Tepidimicrobium xylanilyticum]|uniref:Radical SAM superfamily protein n=1 Tax=Tepidimicrobium xylanilyticum TaxID=1123352 RepID=A0A1H2YN44_9FIRM|nr:radical SAM protein [Tepidimicrobium xylanilyticum]SDX06653.1 Radical SAM superfamily protein [Tepidimicrobium xylanilyticum]
MGKKHFIIPIFVPHYGCPHDCVFCNQRRITGLSTDVTPEYVEHTIEEHLTTFPPNDITIEVAFYGGSFTGIDKEIQRQLLAIPLKYKKDGKIDKIRLSTRPDYIDKDILCFLKEYGVDIIELGVQSLDDSVLRKNGRGHNSQQVYMASQLIKEYNFKLGLQMMLGLIGDTKDKMIFTAKEFIKLQPYCVRIYPTLVIKDTYLEKLYKCNRYKPLSLEEAVEISAYLLTLFENNSINVIRIGLQPTETINYGKDVVAGPFHPSFRQLVESYIYRVILEEVLSSIVGKIGNDIVKIEINKSNISNLVGQKSHNVEYLVNKYGLKAIKVYGNELDKDIIGIYVGQNYYRINKKGFINKLLNISERNEVCS